MGKDSASAGAATARRRGWWRDRVEHAAFVGAIALLGVLPGWLSAAAGRALGRLAYLVLRRRREIARANLRLVFGHTRTDSERDGIARASFESLGQLVTEFARLPWLTRLPLESHVRFEGWEHLVAARARGRGVVYLSAHFGAWEMLPYAHARNGVRVTFVVRESDNPRIDAVLRRYREAAGNVAIPKRNALRECLRRLQAGEMIGMLIDQHVPPDRGLPTHLLGQPVHTLAAPALLARRTGAALMVAFALREPRGGHRIVILPEIEPVHTGSPESDLIATTERINQVVGEQVERHPDLWLWAHRRFRPGDCRAVESGTGRSGKREGWEGGGG